MPRIRPEELTDLAARALMRAGAREGMARAAAEALVTADMQELATHGVSRVPFYCAMLRNGRAIGTAEPSIISGRGAACLVDNACGLAYESVRLAVDEAGRRAREYGIGFAGITNGNHMGALAIALLPLAREGLVGIALSGSPAAIPAWGGKRALYGTNPIAAVFPRRNVDATPVDATPVDATPADPVVVDLSLTTVTRGRIMLAAQKGEPIPEGWALDREGLPTTDAKAALDGGSLFPIGGAKGAALALAVELLCVALTGAAFGFENDSFFAERGNVPRIGQAFLAIDPGALAGSAVYLQRVETLVHAMLDEEEVRLPGARRFAAERNARVEGIEIPAALAEQLRTLAGG